MEQGVNAILSSSLYYLIYDFITLLLFIFAVKRIYDHLEIRKKYEK